MLVDDTMEMVLISTSPEPTGHERLVVAFRDGPNFLVPLDRDRPANRELLDAETIYVRHAHEQHRCSSHRVLGHRPLEAADRARLEEYAHTPISDATEILHIAAEHLSSSALADEPPGFVAIVDGSERAARALRPALELARWYGRPCSIVEVTAGADDRDTDHAIALQLDDLDLDMRDVASIAKVDLVPYLFDVMRKGHVVVASAFGVWAPDGRIHGMLNGLVRHNAPAIIGIGPNVMPDWRPDTSDPILVCVDATEHARHIVDKLDPFVTPSRARLIVAHVETERNDESNIATEVADEIHRRFGIPVEARSITAEGADTSAATSTVSAAEEIAVLASRLQCQLVITHSWHRPEPGRPPISSTSLTAVAHTPCPVVILSD